MTKSKKPRPATPKQLAKIADLIQAPEGWTRELLAEQASDGISSPYAAEKTTTIILRSEKVRLVFRLHPSSWGGPWAIDGTTAFESPRGWVSFDRRGIDDSFYVTPKHLEDGATLAGIAQAQIDRVRLYLEQDATKVTVPGFAARRTAEQVAELKKRLQKGGSIEFTPSGMGTGYRVSMRRTADARPAARETVEFFGVGPLWLSTFDYD